MSTSDSGSPNLLDEFFSSTTPANAGDSAQADSGEGEEEVVDEVEAVAEDEAPPPPVASRRSVPPPAPSKRGGKRSVAAPPPRNRASGRPSSPPPPPSVRSTWSGEHMLEGVAERPSAPPPVPSFEDNPLAFPSAPSAPAGVAARFEPETTPGGFDEMFADSTDDVPLEAPIAEAPAPEVFAEMPAMDVAPEIPMPDLALDAPMPAAAEDGPASPDTDMATALAASLSLKGDVPSAPVAPDGSAVEPVVGEAEPAIVAGLVVPPGTEPAEASASSAWPSPSKIDEWDDDWAPSLSALGARAPARSAEGESPAPAAAKSSGSAAPFRLSLPPPPPPPPRRSSGLPLPRPMRAVGSIFSVDDVKVEDAPPPAVEATDTAPASDPIIVTSPEDEHPSLSMEVSPFGAADDPSREDLTRPLPPTELARLAASEENAPDHKESELLRDDVTIPLPGLDGSSGGLDLSLLALPDPYTSDTDLTRPLISPIEGGRFTLPPLRPAPDGDAAQADVRHIMAVPPPSVGTVEDAPTIQIAQGGSEYTPTSQLMRPGVPMSSTSPGLRSVLPPIPKPAPVPTDFLRRVAGQSVPPVSGSVFPPGLPIQRRWLIAIAAVVLGVLALGLGLRSRSGSLVVTVAGPSGAAVPGVTVRIDGTEVCSTAPCVVKDVKPGMHLVSATATGMPASAERAIVVEAGEQVAHHVVLSQEEKATAGLSVAAIGSGLHVLVDGRDQGAPPVTLNDIVPGEHTVRILGPERYYQPYEEVVRLDRGEVRSLGPVRLRVLRGKLDIRAGEGSDGAVISVDGRRVWHLPASIELSAEESHEVTALKQGAAEFTQEVVFDGTAERSVTVSFGSDSGGLALSNRSLSAAPALAHAASTTFASTGTSHAAASRSLVASPPSTPATTGMATLDLNSTPPAAVVVNGRPMGTTPLHGIKVGAGKQTVLFVHPSLGRKVASANVAPGGRATIGVKF